VKSVRFDLVKFLVPVKGCGAFQTHAVPYAGSRSCNSLLAFYPGTHL
jgi:hypothetical protein